MSTATVEPIVGLQKQVLSVQQNVGSLVISNTDEYLYASELSKTIAQLRKQVDETFDPIISKAHEAHKEALTQKKKFSLPLELNQRTLDGKLLAYGREQERIRREQEEELRKQAQKEQEDQAIREAEELHRQGETQLADIVLESAASAPAPVVSIPSSVPRVDGIAKREVWKFEITNPDLIPREYCTPDQIKIGGIVRALKGATRINGVRVYSEQVAIHR